MSESFDEAQPPPQRSILDLLYVGFNSRVAALDRQTGQIVWQWKAPKGRSPHVAVLLDGDRLMVSVHGYTYCLDTATGEQLWSNPFAGFGLGLPSLASIHGNSGSAAAAAIIAQQQAAAAGGA